MKLLACAFVLLSAAVSSASAAILIYEGPAPITTIGDVPDQSRNRAYLVVDSETKTVQMVNYFSPRGSRTYVLVAPLETDGATIPGRKNSQTVAAGVSRAVPQIGETITTMLSFRGRNRVLNNSTDLVGPRSISGVYRELRTVFNSATQVEQRFSLVYARTLSNAANSNSESLSQAVERVKSHLENRRYMEQER